MQPVTLEPLHQVEYSVEDLSYSERFFAEVFGEKEVEASFSRALSNPALEIRHCGLGLTVQQLCQPLMPGLPHHDALQRVGNCVHNLCFLVDDIDNIVANADDVGIGALIEFPLTEIWEQDIAPENLCGNHHSCILETQALLGFQLELAEIPWREEPDPPLMLPAFGPQWGNLGLDVGNRLLGINVVVADLEATLAALKAIFSTSFKLVTPPCEESASVQRFMVVGLGLVRLVYMQAFEDTVLHEFLQRRGPAVHSLLIETADLERAVQAAENLSISSSQPAEILLTALDGPAHSAGAPIQLCSETAMGVEFTLVPARPRSLLAE